MASSALLGPYLDAHSLVVSEGFERELVEAEAAGSRVVDESRFLRELAWCVLSAGMSYRVVASVFPAISLAFRDFASALAITEDPQAVEEAALSVFGNRRKISCIMSITGDVADVGFDPYWDGLQADWEVLESYPQIGPLTSRHLAKNLGQGVAKPDRHLSRIAARVGLTVDDMVNEISSVTGDPVELVDAVLWRYATLSHDYVSEFAS